MSARVRHRVRRIGELIATDTVTRAAATDAEHSCLRASLPIHAAADERAANDTRGSTRLPADGSSSPRARAGDDNASVASNLGSAKYGSIARSPSGPPTGGAASRLQRRDGRHCGGADLPGGASSATTGDESATVPRHETFPTAQEPAQLVGNDRSKDKNASFARRFVGAVATNLEPNWDAESRRALVDLFRLLNAWYEEDRR